MNIGPMEVIIIFVVALLVFGPAKLPEIGRQVGKAVREFRRFQSSFQNDFKDFLDEPGPVEQTPNPAGAEQAAQTQADPPDAAAPAGGQTPVTGPAGASPSGPAVPLRPMTGDESPASGNGDGVTG
ncbi:MAG: Sec-independent protein translocase subunit TatA/TatB, partial [Acidimicrobiia bacterium]